MTERRFGVERITDLQDTVIRLRGDIDLSVAAELGEELQSAIKQAERVVVDLADVTFLDSTGVRALVDAYRSANELGHHLYVRGARDWVARVLEVTGVGPLLALPESGRGS